MKNRTYTTINIKDINRRLIGVVIFLAALFVLSQIVATSQVGTKSGEITAIKNQKAELERQLRNYEAEIAQKSSSMNSADVVEKLNLQQKIVEQIPPASDDNVAFGN